MNQKVYVEVNSDFDRTGFMQPRTITWPDGRVFKIDNIRSFCPAGMSNGLETSMCYVVQIKGEERLLFFERSKPMFTSLFGRWFVEKASA